MNRERAAYFLQGADRARARHEPFRVTEVEFLELLATIDDPPEVCPTCGTPTSHGCTRDIDVDDSMGPHWLPPAPMTRDHYSFCGAPILVVDDDMAD